MVYVTYIFAFWADTYKLYKKQYYLERNCASTRKKKENVYKLSSQILIPRLLCIYWFILFIHFTYVFSSFLISWSVWTPVSYKFLILCRKWNICSDKAAKSIATNWKPSLTSLTKTENCPTFLTSPLSGISIKAYTKFLHFSSRSHCVSLLPAAAFERLIFSIDLFLRRQYSCCLN